MGISFVMEDMGQLKRKTSSKQAKPTPFKIDVMRQVKEQTPAFQEQKHVERVVMCSLSSDPVQIQSQQEPQSSSPDADIWKWSAITFTSKKCQAEPIQSARKFQKNSQFSSLTHRFKVQRDSAPSSGFCMHESMFRFEASSNNLPMRNNNNSPSPPSPSSPIENINKSQSSLPSQTHTAPLPPSSSLPSSSCSSSSSLVDPSSIVLQQQLQFLQDQQAQLLQLVQEQYRKAQEQSSCSSPASPVPVPIYGDAFAVSSTSAASSYQGGVTSISQSMVCAAHSSCTERSSCSSLPYFAAIPLVSSNCGSRVSPSIATS